MIRCTKNINAYIPIRITGTSAVVYEKGIAPKNSVISSNIFISNAAGKANILIIKSGRKARNAMATRQYMSGVKTTAAARLEKGESRYMPPKSDKIARLLNPDA